MPEITASTDLTLWAPTKTQLPPAWQALTSLLAQETRDQPRQYIMNTRYDDQGVGNLLQSWDLPWTVVIAGYLWEYDEDQIRSHDLPDTELVLSHIRASIDYVNYIEDEQLPPLLTPPYHDLGALLIAVAAYYRAFHTLLSRHSRLTSKDSRQIRRVGQTLLHITKRLGMWYFKREIEDLKEQLCDPANFAKDQLELQRILEQDATKLADMQQLLKEYYRQLTGEPIVVDFRACGVAGLKRRIQDAHTTATSQKTQLTGFDVVTFDIAVPTIQACYIALGVISQLGHIQDRVTDQVAYPKPNGYSHIALGLVLEAPPLDSHAYSWMGERNCTCFIQIATPLMQAIMRYGCLHPDCYQLYLRSSQKKPELPNAKNFWQSSEGKVFVAIKESFELDRQPDTKMPIIVYDKSRKAIALPVGATALDFAYAVDISLGERAVEAFINNRKAPLYRTLDTGDIVEIRTSKETQAREYWLEESYVITPLARHHIRKLLNQRHLAHKGYTLLNEALAQYYYKLTPEELDEELLLLVQAFNLGTRQSYLEQLSPEASEQFAPAWAAQKIIEQMVERNVISSLEEHSWRPRLLSSNTTTFIPQSLCAICQPDYPRDKKIVGHQRHNGAIIVHSAHCPRLAPSIVGPHSTFVPMIWQYLPPAFKVTFIINAQNHRDLSYHILRQLRRHQCHISSFHANTPSGPAQSTIRIVIEAQDDWEALSIWHQLEQVEGVQKVTIDVTTTLPHVCERLKLQYEQTSPSPEQATQYPAWEKMLATLPPRRPTLLNPFDISRPATTKMFFGRSSEIKKMQRDLCNGEHGKALMLYGPRRSGKSSLCKNFLERHVHPPFWHVFFSLQGMTQQNEVSILSQIAEEVGRAFREQMHHSAPHWRDCSDSDPHIRFKHIVQNCLSQVPGSRLILTLDEFGGALDAYEKHFLEKRFFTFWRDLISEISQLSLVIVLPTSSHKLLSTTDLSHAFTFAESLSLTFLDQTDAEHLLVDPLKEQDVAIYPATVARATDLTGGNPYYLTLIGLQLIQQLNDEPSQQLITEKDLLFAVDNIIEAGSTQNFTFYHQELQSSDELRILEAFVELTSRTHLQSLSLKKIAARLETPVSAITPHLQRLHTGLILDEYRRERSSTLPSYSFKVDLVRLWMSRNRWFFTL